MLIETVLMRQHYGLSVCVTTQVGCSGCTFCASGLIKKQRDLNNGNCSSNYVGSKIFLTGVVERVGHIVVMGIGEPFDNTITFELYPYHQ